MTWYLCSLQYSRRVGGAVGISLLQMANTAPPVSTSMGTPGKFNKTGKCRVRFFSSLQYHLSMNFSQLLAVGKYFVAVLLSGSSEGKLYIETFSHSYSMNTHGKFWWDMKKAFWISVSLTVMVGSHLKWRWRTSTERHSSENVKCSMAHVGKYSSQSARLWGVLWR